MQKDLTLRFRHFVYFVYGPDSCLEDEESEEPHGVVHKCLRAPRGALDVQMTPASVGRELVLELLVSPQVTGM